MKKTARGKTEKKTPYMGGGREKITNDKIKKKKREGRSWRGRVK